MTQRFCGTCTACCKTHPVKEIRKAPNQWCRHCAKGRGCRIYDTRPRGCREFQCQWLKSGWAPDERPDKTRIVVDCVEYPGVGQVVLVFELIRGDLQGSFARIVRDRALSRGMSLMTIPVTPKFPATLYTHVRLPSDSNFALDDEREIKVVYLG